MKVLVLGGGGMLGHKIVQNFKQKFEVFTTFHHGADRYRSLEFFRGACIIENINAENTEAVENTIRKYSPDVVLNCIGVIKQLPQSKNVVKILTINSIFPHQLAHLSEAYGFRLINISTDCVFNGKKGDYLETDIPDAFDLYGKSKNLGEVTENNCLTLRTSIIGRELFTKHSLVEWFLSQRGGKVKGFVNAIFTGFPTVVLAEILENVILEHSNLQGLFHVSSEKINKYALLALINREFKAGIEIEPESDFVLDRSLDSNKFRSATGFKSEDWGAMIKKMAEDAIVYELLER